MLLTEFINELRQILLESGDMDVVCVTPISPDFDNELVDDHFAEVDTDTYDRDHIGVTTNIHLQIGL